METFFLSYVIMDDLAFVDLEEHSMNSDAVSLRLSLVLYFHGFHEQLDIDCPIELFQMLIEFSV